MMRLDMYVKVELELDEGEKAQRVASEVERALRRLYGVRGVEITNTVEREE